MSEGKKYPARFEVFVKDTRHGRLLVHKDPDAQPKEGAMGVAIGKAGDPEFSGAVKQLTGELEDSLGDDIENLEHNQKVATLTFPSEGAATELEIHIDDDLLSYTH